MLQNALLATKGRLCAFHQRSSPCRSCWVSLGRRHKPTLDRLTVTFRVRVRLLPGQSRVSSDAGCSCRSCLLEVSALRFGCRLVLLDRRAGMRRADFSGICDRCSGGLVLGRHQIRSQASRIDVYWLKVGLPHLQVVFSICQNLPGGLRGSEGLADVARHNRSIVEQIQKTATVLG
jgi:hypothetical protein